MFDLKDDGPDPCALDLKQAALENEKYREALWTGDHFQVTLMCIPAGYSDIYYLNQVKADSHFGMGTTYVSSFSTKRTVKENQALFAKSGKKIDKGDAKLPYYKEVTVRRSGMGWKVTISDSIGQEESSYSVK